MSKTMNTGATVKNFSAVVRSTDGRLSVTGHTDGERDVTVIAHDSHNCTDVAAPSWHTWTAWPACTVGTSRGSRAAWMASGRRCADPLRGPSGPWPALRGMTTREDIRTMRAMVTGLCGVCNKRVRLDAVSRALISHGHRSGCCAGSLLLPLETSPATLEVLVHQLQFRLDNPMRCMTGPEMRDHEACAVRLASAKSRLASWKA